MAKKNQLKTYLEFSSELNEIDMTVSGGKGTAFLSIFTSLDKDFEKKNYNIVGQVHNYNIYKTMHSTDVFYYTVDENGKTTMFVLGNQKNNTFEITIKAAKKNNPFKMFELYVFLIKKLNLVLSTSSQTEAGRRVWSKLATVPGISIHGWIDGKPLNIHLNKDQELVYAFSDLDGTKYQKPHKGTEDYLSVEEIKAVKLVAHKKE